MYSRILIGASIAIDGTTETARAEVEGKLLEALRQIDPHVTLEVSDPIEIGPAEGRRSTPRPARRSVR